MKRRAAQGLREGAKRTTGLLSRGRSTERRHFEEVENKREGIVIGWFVLAVLSALGYGAHSVYLKQLTGEIDRLVVAWGTFVWAVPIFGAVLWWEGGVTVGTGFWWAFAVAVVANLGAWPLFVEAVERSDLSLVMPMLAFTPVCILGTEYVLLGETPAGTGWGGVGLVVVGAYVLNIDDGIGHVLDPLRALGTDAGAMMMLGVAAMWSFSATVEKVTVTEASPAFYLTMLSAAMGIGLVPLMVRQSERPWKQAWERKGALFVLAGFFVGMLVAQMYAVRIAPVVNYVISIKRLGLIVSVGAGFWWFGEGNVLYRTLGVVVMVAGAVLIRVA